MQTITVTTLVVFLAALACSMVEVEGRYRRRYGNVKYYHGYNHHNNNNNNNNNNYVDTIKSAYGSLLRTCRYEWYTGKYVCYYLRNGNGGSQVKTTPTTTTTTTSKPTIGLPVPQCSTSQARRYYTQLKYSDCCENLSHALQGDCCRYAFYWDDQFDNPRANTYCMCRSANGCGRDIGGNNGNGGIPPPTTPTTTPKAATTTTTPEATTTTTTAATTTTPIPTTTTTTTTTEATTTIPVKKLCPENRLLNSEKADECEFPGIASIERTDASGNNGVTACNGVFVAARIGDRTRPAFYTSNVCRETLEKLAKNAKQPFIFKIANRSIPIHTGDVFETIDDPSKGSSFYVVKDIWASMFNFAGSCQNAACVMTKEMKGEIDYSDCEVVSYGADSTKLTYSGLRKVKVHFTTNDFCSDQKEFFKEANTMCFTTRSDKNIFCSNDMGAAVYCKAKSGEKIMIGSAAFQRACDASPNFRVIPYPVTSLTPVPLA